MTQEFGVEAFSARYLALVCAKDRQIFQAAREANAVVLTKDVDFTLWLKRLGAYLKKLLRKTLRPALEMITSGEALVEIADLP